MELRCPSCGNAHNTEDYPGAFEIQCSCGYSILVPDEQSLSANIPVDETHGFKDAPMAFDSEEEANKISVEPDENLVQEEVSDQQDHISSLGMTDPEELPEEMPYDPFELNAQEEVTDDDEEEVEPYPSFDLESGSEDDGSPPDQSFEPTDFEAGTSDYIEEESDETANNDSAQADTSEETEIPESPSQEVVSKVQWSSLGQSRGAFFSIQFANELSPEDTAGVLDSLEDGLILSPWLKESFSLNRVEIEQKIKEKHLSRIPELLALQVYIHCLEKQIRCEINLDQ